MPTNSKNETGIPSTNCGNPEECDLVKYFKTMKTQVILERCNNCTLVKPESYKIKPHLKYITLQDNFDQWRNKFNAVISKVRNVEEFPPFPTKVDGQDVESIDNFVLSTSYLVDEEDDTSKQIIVWKSFSEYLKEYSVQFTPKTDETVEYVNDIVFKDDYENTTVKILKNGSAYFDGMVSINGSHKDLDDVTSELISLDTNGSIVSRGDVYSSNYHANGLHSSINFHGNPVTPDTITSYIEENNGTLIINSNKISKDFCSFKSDIYINNGINDFIIRNNSTTKEDNEKDFNSLEFLFNSVNDIKNIENENFTVPLTIHTTGIEIGRENTLKKTPIKPVYTGFNKSVKASEYEHKTDLDVYGDANIAGKLYVRENTDFLGDNFNISTKYMTINGQTNSIPANLEIKANAFISGNNLSIDSVTSITKDLNVVGDINCSGKLFQSIWNDICEFFERGEETEPGDIIALDENNQKEQYIKANSSSKCVVGVHSNSYGHCLGGNSVSEEENLKNYIPVALCGRVYVKIYGIVEKGDYIVPSDILGIGKRLENNKEHIIGIALETKNTIGINKVRIKVIN